MGRLSTDVIFSLQLLLNHHEIETYDSLGYHVQGVLATVSVRKLVSAQEL